MGYTRLRRTSPANSGPKLFHHMRTVSWQMSIALEQQVFHVPHRQRDADVHRYHKPDHLR
jgi:hypothetical protein